MDLPSHIQKPKLCSLRKWENYAGYGFNLHSEKGKSGQFIGKVDANSPADLGGLNSHDVLIEVNGINVEDASHNIVVGRVKSIPDRVDLFVCCKDTYSYCKENNIKLSSAMHNIMEYNTPMRQPPAEEKKPTSSIPTNRSDYQPTSTSAVAAAAAASLQAAVDECGGVEFEEVKPGELPERFRSDLSGEVPIRQRESDRESSRESTPPPPSFSAAPGAAPAAAPSGVPAAAAAPAGAPAAAAAAPSPAPATTPAVTTPPPAYSVPQKQQQQQQQQPQQQQKAGSKTGSDPVGNVSLEEVRSRIGHNKRNQVKMSSSTFSEKYSVFESL